MTQRVSPMAEPYPTHLPWRIECRGCGAWLVTPLVKDVESWMQGHKHRPANQRLDHE